MQAEVRQKRCAASGHPALLHKGRVLIGGAGGRVEGDAVVDDELAAVQCRPNDRDLGENALLLCGVEHVLVLIAVVDVHLAVARGVMLEVVALHDVKTMAMGVAPQRLEHVGGGEVVRLADADVLACRMLDTLVHRVTVAGVRLVHKLDAAVAFLILADDVGRIVGRAVVDADDLDVLERLAEQAVKAFGQVLRRVVDGYEN